MTTDKQLHANLSLKRSLIPETILSIIIAFLMTAAALIGILEQGAVYPAEDLLGSFLPTDVTVLIIGVPMLLASLWLTWRGKLIGLLFWPGALLFVIYNYLVYILAMPFNYTFLLHLALVTLGLYTLVSLVAAIDGGAVKEKLTTRVPERFAGGVLAGLGILFLLRVAVVLIGALINGEPLSRLEIALNVTDFLVSPAWVVCGILLWQRKAFGFLSGLGMLFQGSMLFIALIILMIVQSYLTGSPAAPFDIILVFIMGLICFIPFWLYGRGVTQAQKNLT